LSTRKGKNNKIKKDNILYEKDIVQEGDRVHTSKKQDNTSAEVTPNTGSGGGSLKTGDQNHPSKISPETDEGSSDFEKSKINTNFDSFLPDS
jgi:hypothetical protein